MTTSLKRPQVETPNSEILENQIPEHSIYNTHYYLSWKSLLGFELKSFLGRKFFTRKPPLTAGTNLLHLGSGTYKLANWINADFFLLRFWNWHNCPHKPDWMLDLRYPLNCEDNVWDGVFSEHTLEHLYPAHALQLLKELHRTMKPGAWLRISVPDLGKYVEFYQKQPVNEEFSNTWDNGCEAIRNLTQNYIHLSVWDRELLARFLTEAGFSNIQEVAWGKGSDSRLFQDRSDRQWESLYLEAQKL